jgi:hypothetical protein
MSASGTGTAKPGHLPFRGTHDVSGHQETRLEVVPRKPPRSEGVVQQEGIVERASVISIDEIYRAPEVSIELGAALRLLRETISNCGEALSALEKGEPIEADAAMLRVRVELPELFCCRAIGDGFAEIINAVQSVFENLNGELFTAGQVEAVRKALIAIRNEPRMPFDKSLSHVSTMEEMGLKTEPSDIDNLSEWLDD